MPSLSASEGMEIIMQILNVITDEAADSVYLQFGNQPISHSVELTSDIIIGP